VCVYSSVQLNSGCVSQKYQHGREYYKANKVKLHVPLHAIGHLNISLIL